MRGLSPFIAVGLVALVAACSLLTTLDDLGAGSTGDGCAAGSACVPTAPAGWSGPFWIYDGDRTQLPSSCPSATPQVVVRGNAGLVDGSATCTSPGCDASMTGSCSENVHVSTLDQALPCGSLLTTFKITDDGGCFPTLTQAGKNYFVQFNGAPDATTCDISSDPVDGSASLTWTGAMIGCGDPAPASCGSGQVCLVSPPLPFESKPCVYKAGATSCPGAPYSSQRSPALYAGATASCDTSGCSCNVNVECGNTVDWVGATPGCIGDANVAYQPTGICNSVGIAVDAGTLYVRVTPSPSTVQCTATSPSDAGCSPQARFEPSDPLTVCCMP